MTEHDSDIFLRAIDVLAERGWHQGSWTDPDRSPDTAPVCVMGACGVAQGLRAMDVCLSDEEAERLRAAVGVGEPSELPYGSIHDCVIDDVAAWNDAPERTYEDVVLALKRAAHDEQVA